MIFLWVSNGFVCLALLGQSPGMIQIDPTTMKHHGATNSARFESSEIASETSQCLSCWQLNMEHGILGIGRNLSNVTVFVL